MVQDADGAAGEDQPADAITDQEHRRGSSQGLSLGGLWGSGQ